jgi:chorismate mutase
MDPARVQTELDTMAAQAVAAHIDPGYVTRVFTDQVNANQAIQYTRFAGWKLNPTDAPAAAPDLSASRATIDGLNETMLTQITADWEVLGSPGCPSVLDAARADVTRVRQFDELYQRALWVATSSFCR